MQLVTQLELLFRGRKTGKFFDILYNIQYHERSTPNLIGGWAADKVGRKRTLIYSNLGLALVSLLASYSPGWKVFAVFWIAIWTFCSATYTTGSVYVVELLGDDNREWAMLVR